MLIFAIRCFGLLILCMPWLVVAATGPRPTDPPVLGDAPTAGPGDLLPRVYAPRGAPPITAPVEAITTGNRTDVVVLYHQTYLASDNSGDNIAWTGTVPGCVPGTVSLAFQQDTLRRINYFRVMAGLPGDIVFDPSKNQASQASSLIMSANNQLSHTPSSSWDCYTASGYQGANKGNLYLGRFGPDSVDGFIFDPGANNTAVGHRRWLLYPPAQVMGGGAIPGSGQTAAQTIWVIGDFGTRPAQPTWTGWPNPGYVPHNLVYPRWSFSQPNINMNNVNITMTRDGQPVSINKLPVSNGAGDNTVVWEPVASALPDGAPATDIVYQVTLSGAVNRSYSVIAIDPFRLLQSPVISGTVTPILNQANNYSLSPVDQATAYRIKSARASVGNWLEGAENGYGNVADGTADSYGLISTATSASGSAAFHLTMPSFNEPDQLFALNRDVVPGATSMLRFQKRRRFMSPDQVVHGEISTDGGESWTELWRQAGTDSSESGFSAVNLNLGGYAGQIVRVRFRLSYQCCGSAYVDTSPSVGVYIDDIQVTQSQELVNATLQTVTATTFDFQPTQEATYYLMAQPRVGGRYFGFGPARAVTAQQGGAGPGEVFSDGFEN